MNNRPNARIQRVIDIVRTFAEKSSNGGDYAISNRMDEISFHFEGYAEPGYNVGEAGVVATGNWNNIDRYDFVTKSRVHVSNLPSRLCDVLEKLGVDIEWSDEWAACSHCGKLVRTSGDSYCWQPSYVLGDGEISCIECVKEDPESHLESLEDDDSICNTIDSINPESYGYSKLEDCESGWHPGQNDSPSKIATALRAKGITRFIFNLDENSQFYSKWSVWIHESESDILNVEEEGAA